MQSECEEGVSEGNEGLDVERSAAGQPDAAGWCCGYVSCGYCWLLSRPVII